MRLDKFICKSTELTKDQAIECIYNGEVSVNGEVTTNEAKQVHENNSIKLSERRLKTRDFRYILLHKPANTICSNVNGKYPSLFNYVDIDKVSELHIAGRLDVDTTGLVLITDNGRWSYNITSPKNACRKVYRVRLAKEISPDVTSKFKHGLQLQGEQRLTLPAVLTIIEPKLVLLTLTEGKFHQVKRMFAAVGNRVVSLHREQIGDVYLDVEVGQWRYLTKDEIASFKQ